MDNRLEHRAPWIPWAATAILLTVVAIVAYLFGTHQAAVVPTDSAVRTWGPYPFHPFLALIFFFWIFGGLRWMVWGAWGRPWRYRRGPWGHPCYDRWMDDDLTDWHRREHERMPPSRSTVSSSADVDERPR